MKDVDMKVLYDEDFVDMLCHAAASQGLPAGTLGEQSQTLDHGTMVPLHFILQDTPIFGLCVFQSADWIVIHRWPLETVCAELLMNHSAMLQ